MSDLLSTRAAAALLGVGTTTIKRWADEEVLACVKTAGGHRRFRRTDLESMHAPTGHHPPLHRRLGGMDRASIDALDAGVIQLDDAGKILLYNRAESAFSGLQAAAVVGRHLFGDVAPCMNNSLVFGSFQSGVAAGELDVRIDYTFTFRMRPTNVALHLFRDAVTGTNWMIVYQR
ncbi:MAG: helix-turn-helix domain-containing protein [Myxococcales bacterium]|nr:helix-turn-helix domain-containing protein [Myxococcales bacterium]